MDKIEVIKISLYGEADDVYYYCRLETPIRAENVTRIRTIQRVTMTQAEYDKKYATTQSAVLFAA